MNASGGTFFKTLFHPAVVDPVAEGMMPYREGQFGPIIPVAPFDDVETALDYVTEGFERPQVAKSTCTLLRTAPNGEG